MKRIWFPLLGTVSLSIAVISGFLFAHAFSSPNPQILPTSFSLYDTSTCHSYPSISTCDGRLPVAEWDMGLPAGKQGNEACLDGTLQEVSHAAIQAGQHAIGTLQLLWAPSCHSHFAKVHVSRSVNSIGLRLSERDDPPGARPATTGIPPHRTVSSLLDFGGGSSEVNEAVSPLLFQRNQEATITVLAIITFPDTTSTQTTLSWTGPPSRHPAMHLVQPGTHTSYRLYHHHSCEDGF
jgi:hypothetical protein